MKVIIAGLPKTGTTSLAEALRMLGYEVYDLPEHLIYHGDEWMKILNGDIRDRKKIFAEMYKNVDAGCDSPFTNYWQEIFETFPQAKVILSVRSNEDAWLKSVRKQIDALQVMHTWWSRVVMRKYYLYWRAEKFFHTWASLVSGKELNRAALLTDIDDERAKYAYRKHIADVKRVVPGAQLLQYNISDGWMPLVEFLEQPTPKMPFPHSNKGASNVTDWGNPMTRRLLIFNYSMMFLFLIVLFLLIFFVFSLL